MRTKVFLLLVTASLIPVPFLQTSARKKEMAIEMTKSPRKKEIKTLLFRVEMDCEKCVEKINENLAFEKGVVGLEVSLDKQLVTILYDAAKTDEIKLQAALKKLGYTATKVSGVKK